MNYEQECIPVGCVPSAAVAVSRGVCLVPWGCALSWGVYLVWGGVPGPGGPGLWGCTWSRGVYLVQGGVPGPGGCTWSWGVYLVRGVYLVWRVYLVRGVLGLGVTWSQGGVPGHQGGGTWSQGVPGQVLPATVDSHTPVKT